MNINGFQIITDIHMIDYYHSILIIKNRKIKTRKFKKRLIKRLNTKPKEEIIKFGDKLVMHPVVAEQLLKDKRFQNEH